MDYNIAARSQTPMRLDVDENIGMAYGVMPPELLTQKFEVTDGIDPIKYEDDGTEAAFDTYREFARNNLIDWGSDPTSFEHEQKRTTTQAGGHLNIRYGGHRGVVDGPDHGEMFLGFAGGDAHDPRGINVDPDMKQYRKQAEARTKYHRFTKDHVDNTTSGSRNQAKVRDDNQAVIRGVRSRMKVFSRSLEGGMAGRALVANSTTPSNVGKCNTDNRRGENMGDGVLARANTKHVTSDEQAPRSLTQHQFSTVDYSQMRRRNNKSDNSKIIGKSEVDIKSDAIATQAIKSVAQTMQQMVVQRSTVVSVDGKSHETYTQKTVLPTQLEHQLRLITNNTTFGGHTTNTNSTSAAPTRIKRHETTNQHDLVAFADAISRKHAAAKSSPTNLREEIIATGVTFSDHNETKNGKVAKQIRIKRGDTTGQQDDVDGVVSVAMKKPIVYTKKRAETLTTSEFAYSDNTQSRKIANPTIIGPGDVKIDRNFANNGSIERRRAAPGTRITNHNIIREEESRDVVGDI
jgi:hypothetical protein